MPTYTPKRLSQNQLTTSYVSQYTATAVTCIVKEVVVCNVTAGNVALDVCLVPVAGTADASTAVIFNAPIPAYTTVIYTFSSIVPTSGFISAKATAASSLTVTISGVEYV